MRRREFITLLGGAAWRGRSRRGRSRRLMPMVGYLANATPSGFAHFAAAFRRGLGELGYVEGRTVAIEYRWAEGQARPAAGTCRRSDRPPRGRDHGHRRQCTCTCRQGCDHDDSHCIHGRCRSGESRTRCQPEPAGRERHRGRQYRGRTDGQTVGTLARVGADGRPDRGVVQSGESNC